MKTPMNSGFVNPGIYSCVVDAFLEVSTHLSSHQVYFGKYLPLLLVQQLLVYVIDSAAYGVLFTSCLHKQRVNKTPYKALSMYNINEWNKVSFSHCLIQ